MAVFTASPLTNPAPTVAYNLPADLQAAQQIQQGQNALTAQGQKISDMQQEVALRPGIAAGDPQALNALSVIDPRAASGALQFQIAKREAPIAYAQRVMGALGQQAQGILTLPPDQRPAAYEQWRANANSLYGTNIPAGYNEPEVREFVFGNMAPGDYAKYLQNQVYPAGGGAPATGAAAPASGLPAAVPLTPDIQAASTTYGVPAPLIGAVMTVESGGNQGAVSDKGAIGRMQLMPGTASGLGVNPNDPQQNLAGGTQYLGQQIARYGGNTDYGLMAYNWGPQNVDNWLKAGANPNAVPADVRDYVQKVHAAMGAYASNPPSLGMAAYTPGSEADAQDQPAGQPTPLAPPSIPSTATRLYTPLMRNGMIITNAAGDQLVQYGDGSQGYVPVSGGAADPAVIQRNATIKSAADAGYQVVNGQYVPITGGPADPAVINRTKAAGAQAAAAAAGPIPGGAAVAPPETAGGGPFPLPPTDPYAGQNNNAALATRMNADRTEADKTVAADAPVIQKDLANIQFDQQFHEINSGNPTGPNAGSWGADFARSNLPFTPSNAPYQEMKKLSANLQTAALPTNLGRLDLPIIKSVAAQQPTVTNLREANDNIENIQIAAAQRDIDYRRARAQWVQQFGNLHGFEQLWADYNNHVPTLSWGKGGTVQLATGQPSFADWVSARAPGGRYNPELAAVPGNQLPGAQPPQQSTVPQTQQAAAQTGRPAIPAAAVAYLHANPQTAAQFDEMFGPGAAKTILGQ